MKKTVKQVIEYLNVYDIEGDIREHLSFVADLTLQYPSAKLRWDHEQEEVQIYIEREETDSEYEYRTQRESATKVSQIEYLKSLAESLGFEVIKN